jgi:hypothetical protein
MRKRLRIMGARYVGAYAWEGLRMVRGKAATTRNLKLAKQRWGRLSSSAITALKELTQRYPLSVALGDLLYFDERWYVSHAGLLRISQKRRCSGIRVECIIELSEPAAARWAFKATVFKSDDDKGFVGYGDANPSNVSPFVHGAEMRVAETRAVNRALRKAYGIGICSVEEIGSFAEPKSDRQSKKLPPQPANGNYGGPKLRDRLYQLIRQHQLDPVLVKAYAVDFCGTKTLRDATREQVENFVVHLADWAEKDRNAVLCQLNSYLGVKDGAG